MKKKIELTNFEKYVFALEPIMYVVLLLMAMALSLRFSDIMLLMIVLTLLRLNSKVERLLLWMSK